MVGVGVCVGGLTVDGDQVTVKDCVEVKVKVAVPVAVFVCVAVRVAV